METNEVKTEEKVTEETKVAPEKDLISISDFAKIELKVAEIKSAEKVENADKLLKLNVSLGDEERQIVAGIAKHYNTEDLVGRKIVVVANLKPAKLRGVESQGMLLAASTDEVLSLVNPGDLPAGAKVR